MDTADFVLRIVGGMCDRRASSHACACLAHPSIFHADSESNYHLPITNLHTTITNYYSPITN